jgi:hypothetical protein
MHNLDRTQGGYGLEMGQFEFGDSEAVFNEAEQAEYAAQLLEVSNEAELEQFLGDLISKAGSAIGSFMHSSTGQALGNALKGVAKQVLPAAGQALGGYLGGSTGAQIGGKLAGAASNLFEAENEEQEWENANTLVKIAADAVKNAASAPPNANPKAVAQNAVMQAAQLHAPGLVAKAAGAPGTHNGNGAHAGPETGKHHGRWVRRGNRIIIMGA